MAPIDSKSRWHLDSHFRTVYPLLTQWWFCETHTHQPPYRHSRGDISFPAFFFIQWGRTFCKRIIPSMESSPLPSFLFNMMHRVVTELVFDGNNPSSRLKKIPQDIPHIWSSSTLYTDEDRSFEDNNVF
jgi:hypothetical protein